MNTEQEAGDGLASAERDTGPDGGLARRAFRGALWSGVEIWGSRVVGTVVFVVLARLLSPAELGAVSLAVAIAQAVRSLGDEGITTALVQRPRLSEATTGTGMWLSVLIAGVGGGLILASAPLMANIFDQPQLAQLLPVLSLAMVFGALGSVPVGLHQRGLRFRLLAIRTLVATIVGGVVGIVMAATGAGAMSIAVMHAVSTGITLLVVWTGLPALPGHVWSRNEAARLTRFVMPVMGVAFLSYLNTHADDLLIGAFLGSAALGLYAVAYRFLQMLNVVLIGVVTQVLVPTFARIQSDRARLAAAVKRVLEVTSLLAAPGFLLVGALAPEITLVLLGERWVDAIALMQVFSLLGPSRSINFVVPNVATAVGRPQDALRVQALNAVTNVLAFAIAAQFSTWVVAVAFVVRSYAVMPYMVAVLRRHAPIGTAFVVRSVLTPLAIGGGSWAVIAMVRPVLESRLGPGPRLGVLGGLGLVTAGLLATLLAGPALRHAWTTVRRPRLS